MTFPSSSSKYLHHFIRKVTFRAEFRICTATDGATTTIEAKRVLKKKNLSQAVGTCVVSSFIERNLHPDKQTAVPTIVIGQHRFQVCLYDCEHDILLVSSPLLLAHPKERFAFMASNKPQAFPPTTVKY